MALVWLFAMVAFLVVGSWLTLRLRSLVWSGFVAAFSRATPNDEEHKRFRAGALAAEMGLELLRGDPNQNLFIQRLDLSGVHHDIFMRGAPHGLPLELRYFYRTTFVREGRRTLSTSEFACDVRVVQRLPFPPFEVVSRTAPIGNIAPRTTLPELRLGDALLDARFMVRASDPRVGSVLAPELLKFLLFESAGLHLIGDGESVRYLLHRDASPVLANALYFAEALALHMSELGEAMERRHA